MKISGLEDEYLLSEHKPRLIYIKRPAPERDPDLAGLLGRIKGNDSVSYKYFETTNELKEFIADDLALLLTERFEHSFKDREPAAHRTAVPPSNLPYELNRFVGRQQQMAAIMRMRALMEYKTKELYLNSILKVFQS